jgi:lambda repressor-like predicted transcriptional regulator
MIDLNTILKELTEDDSQPSPSAICFYPGGFKPPHEGHYEVLKDLAARPYITKVIVLIGHKTRDGITKEQSKRIWDLYLAANPMAKVEVRLSDNPAPIKDIFSIMDNDLELQAYVAGTPEDGEDQSYFQGLTKAFGTRIKPLSIEEKVVTQGKRLSGTDVRNLITQLKKSVLALRSVSDKNSTEYSKARNAYLNTLETLKGCFPEVVIQKGQFDDILKILGIPVLNVGQLQEQDPLTYKPESEDLPVDSDDNVTPGKDLVLKIPYHLTPKIENYLNSNLIPFEYSQYSFGDQARRMVIPSLDDSDNQRAQVLQYLSKNNVPVNVEEDMFTIKWWKKSLDETLSEPQDKTDNIIADFIEFASQALDLQQVPKITFTDDEKVAKQIHALGAYQPNTDKLLVVKGPRLTADILRTLAHELVHRKQDELRPLNAEDGKTGSEIENEANAAAGVLLRQFGQYRPEIFEEGAEEKSHKIYCDMDGVLVDFEKGYEDLTGQNIRGQHVSSGPNFWEPITKAGAQFWIKLPWMADGKQLWEYIKPHNPVLLSAPSREESSKIGKYVWVKREMPGTKLVLRSAERKQEFATPQSILIDDRKDNIDRWKEAGGIGIYHTSAADTIQQLKKLGL